MARGNIYEISDRTDMLGDISEDFFFDMLPSEAEYVQDVTGDDRIEAVRNELESLSRKGFDTGEKEGTFFFTVSEQARKKIFQEVFGAFRTLSEQVKPSDFEKDTLLLWNISNTIRDRDGDLFYLNGTCYDFCGFLRRIKPGQKYYIGNVVFMH